MLQVRRIAPTSPLVIPIDSATLIKIRQLYSPNPGGVEPNIACAQTTTSALCLIGGCLRLPNNIADNKRYRIITKNCFYSDMENKACDDSFVLDIAVNTNVSEAFVFTAILSTNQRKIVFTQLCAPYRCKHKLH